MKFFTVLFVAFTATFGLVLDKAWAGCGSGGYVKSYTPGKIQWTGSGDAVSATATKAHIVATNWSDFQPGSAIKYEDYEYDRNYQRVFVTLEKPDLQDTSTWKWHAKFSINASDGGFGSFASDMKKLKPRIELRDDGCPPTSGNETHTLEDYLAYTPGPTVVSSKNWTTGKDIGDTGKVDANGKEIFDGRMIAPQNHRISPQTPVAIYVLPGGTLNCEVEGATDLDHWTKSQNGTVVESGDESESLSFAWSSSDGTFAAATPQKTTWTAPQTPGTYTLSCTINDLSNDDPAPTGVSSPETGNRNDAALVRSVSVVVAYPTVALSFDASKNAICAGGWSQGFNNEAGGYGYLSKEKSDAKDPNPWVARGARPDPHITTATIKASWPDGTLFKKADVKVSWDMPGPAPAESKTLTTDDNGQAQLDIISGDEVSKHTDSDDSKKSFNHPVEVKAECLGGTGIGKLDVLEPTAEWQYKDKSGNYPKWDGTMWGLFPGIANNEPIPLRVALTFDNQPVFGHSMSWKLGPVYNKSGEEVEAHEESVYIGYGHMSGASSTSDQNGLATATYFFGSQFGQVNFNITDYSVIESREEAAPSSARQTRDVPTYTKLNFQQYLKKGQKFGPYTFPADVGKPSFDKPFSYPAPSGAEDRELLPETLGDVRSALGFAESSVGSRFQYWKYAPSSSATAWVYKKDLSYKDPDYPKDPYQEYPVVQDNVFDPTITRPFLQQGAWWFSQAVGNDHDSAKTHFATMRLIYPKLELDGKTPVLDPQKKPVMVDKLFGAAFDIVLTEVPVFYNARVNKRDRPLGKFKPYVMKPVLRV